MEHKFYTLFLISQMTSSKKKQNKTKQTDADSLIKRPTYIHTFILPDPRRVEFSSEEVIVLPLAPLQVSSYLNWDLGGRWMDVCKL